MQRHVEIAAASGRQGRRDTDSGNAADEDAVGEKAGGTGRREAVPEPDGRAQSRRAAPTRGPGAGSRDSDAMPVALLAVTVNGRCRERSPADLALFGAAGDGFLERFAERHLGQSLFARAVEDGTAEGWAVLLTAAGPMGCRVSLWRQRGGERIRVVAAIAPEIGGAAVSREAALGSEPGQGAPAGRIPWERYAPLLNRSAGAVLDVLDALRRGAKRADRLTIEDALAGVWRVMGLSDELARRARLAGGDEAVTAAALPLPGAGAPPSEIDPSRLLARLMRLAAGEARRRGVQLDMPGAAGVGAAGVGAAEMQPPVAVLADAAALWSALESAIWVALETAGDGGLVRGRIEACEREGLRVCLEALPSDEGRTDDGAVPAGGVGADALPPGPEQAHGLEGAMAGVPAFAATAGARFETVDRQPGWEMCLVFPERAVLWRL
ncbi:MAG: hypothetical protein AAF968_11590 [Pseudomonadota bacterium]